MSETDSFIDEVTEEVRRDKLFATMRRYGWIAIVAVLLIVGGAAWNEWRKASAAAEAQQFGDALLLAVQQDDPAARTEAIAAIPASGGRVAVQGLLAAAQAVEAGDKDAAIVHLRTVAEDAELPASYRELAELKIVILAGDTMEAASRDATLHQLARAGAPYRALAMEQQVLALISAGKPDEAVALARLILVEPGLTAGLRQRVTQLMVALGEDPDAA